MRWFYRAIGEGAWPVMQSHVSWCTKAMRVSLLRQKQYYVVWDDGKPKCEIMVASSVWEGATLWFDVSLLITTPGAVRVGCVPLLFCTVIWCLTRRPGCYMSHMSATGSTEFMKGSDLVLEKSVFTEYVPTRVYRAHLKNIHFSIWQVSILLY